MSAVAQNPPENKLSFVLFDGPYTSPKMKTHLPGKFVIVTGHLTLPKDSTLTVAYLLNVGKITLLGKSAIHASNTVYNGGKIEGEEVQLGDRVVHGLDQTAIGELRQLGEPISLSESGGISISADFLNEI